MKTLMGGLTLAAMLCCMPASQADFVLDDFSVNQVPGVTTSTTALGVNAVDRTTGGVAVINGTDLALNDFGAGTGAVNYDFSVSASPVVSPNENEFVFRNVTATSSGTLTASFTSAAAHNAGAITSVDLAIGGPIVTATDLVLGIMPISDIFTISNINLSWTADTFGGTFRTTQIDVTSVPEPTSVALLGLTGLGGVVVARRRRKTVEA